MVKLMKYLCRPSGNTVSEIVRLVELFSAVLYAANAGRNVIENESGTMQRITVTSMKKQDKEHVELVASQLTRLGLGEAALYLLGRTWATDIMYLRTLQLTMTMLKAGHALNEENRIVQSNMVSFLLADLGEPTTTRLQWNLMRTEIWSKEARQALKRKKKAQKKHRQILMARAKSEGKSVDELNDSTEILMSGENEGMKGNKTRKSNVDEHGLPLVLTMPNLKAKNHSADPGQSKRLLRMLEMLCQGQYLEGQVAMANQKHHKTPVDFITESTKYIATMAKDLLIHSDTLFQAYGTLKSFLTGPCKRNQLAMAMETEMVLITNRILRELYKESKKLYEALTDGSGHRIHILNKKKEMQEEIDTVANYSRLGREVIETLLSMIEGRTDSVVHNRLLAVVQRRNLRDRLDVLKAKITSKFFCSITTRALTEEGVEIMNLLRTLSERDKRLYKEIMETRDGPYQFFNDKMGRVEIMFHDNLLPVFFLVPPMCQVFSHVPLSKMWETCLPRDESTLVKYQYESTRIFDMMKQERALKRKGVSKFFGTGKLAFMVKVSFAMALLINGISLTTLVYIDPSPNASAVQENYKIFTDGTLGFYLETPDLQTYLTFVQCITSSYLLVANM